MVMDATQSQQPSPQSVGREFVRQYYTLLNKAPNHLHRFYNNNSSFIHGESTLVVGQKNIYNRIQQMNFHDCHAKISQVDAQATLGNGVVVQVTGELSNDGQPMRRFTQTFVLASQSPKKYYVHNDIFRYQDVYSDEENDGDARSDFDEHEHREQIGSVGSGSDQQLPPQQQSSQVSAAGAMAGDQQQQIPTQVVAGGSGGGVVTQQQQAGPTGGAPQQQQQAIYYSMPPAGGRPVTVLAAPQGTPVGIGGQFAAPGASGVPPQQHPPVSGGSQLNGVMAHDDMMGMPANGAAQQQIVQATGTSAGGVAVSAGGPAAMPVASVAAPMASFQQAPLLQQPLIQPQVQTLLQSQGSQASVSSGADYDDSTANNNNSQDTTPPSRTPVNVPTPVATPAPEVMTIVEDFKTINEQQQQEKYEAAKQQQNEPKTYANLFKSSSSSPSGFINAAMQQQQQIQQQQSSNSGNYAATASIASSTYSQSVSSSSLSGYNNRNSDSIRSDNNMGQGGPLPQRNNGPRLNKDFDQRRSSNTQQQFGDNQQLFLGNIPHHATEDDLKTIFSRFGTVVELRILSKTGGKLAPGVRNPLNYGFITYEDPDSVQNCLGACPLFFPENSPDRQRLNVEEKKPRMRSNDMPPRQQMGIGGGGMNSSQQRTNMGGGPPSRSMGSNAGIGGNVMRPNNANSLARGNSGGSGGGGPRMGSFNRNDSRSGGPSNNSGSNPQMRGGNNAQSGGSSYGRR